MINVEDTTKTICELADQLTTAERIIEYGHPVKNFTDIAQMWSVILGVAVTPHQVGLCNIATKICREINQKKRDNMVDIAGYAKCVDMINHWDSYEDEED